jgi:hypothetical protein
MALARELANAYTLKASADREIATITEKSKRDIQFLEKELSARGFLGQVYASE